MPKLASSFEAVFALFEPEFLTIDLQGDVAALQFQPRKSSLDVLTLLT